jgi:UDP-N-acetylmuramate dehydrogenase
MAVDALDLTYATGVEVQCGVALGPYTTLKIGGPADYFVRARGAREVSRCLDAAHRAGLPWLLLGGGSNLLVADRGFRGLAIKVERPATRQRNSADVLGIEDDAVYLRCDAGLQSAGLSRWTAALGWSGLEWACGIPGTIGGAAAGNAGAYGGDMQQIVQRVLAWFPGGEREIAGDEMGYAYRTSRFKRAGVLSPQSSGEPAAILSVDLRLTPVDKGECLARIEENERQRREKQPAERSCGSVFKNPYPDAAGRLIDTAGLKGTRVGGAQISEKHGNFFVNRGDTSASDVIRLVRLARERVEQVHGVHLDTEILLVGDWDPEEIAGL